MKVQRIQVIENLIHEKGSVSLDDLCEQFNVSKNTVRRDIAKLLQKNTIKSMVASFLFIIIPKKSAHLKIVIRKIRKTAYRKSRG
ncbi:HTH-type transcriptional regulator IolR [Listeria monocytogenes N53-1]|nr:HTH-type transcriptional regulator IolR [Listeria monocytogenes N53-1]